MKTLKFRSWTKRFTRSKRIGRLIQIDRERDLRKESKREPESQRESERERARERAGERRGQSENVGGLIAGIPNSVFCWNSVLS